MDVTFLETDRYYQTNKNHFLEESNEENWFLFGLPVTPGSYSSLSDSAQLESGSDSSPYDLAANLNPTQTTHGPGISLDLGHSSNNPTLVKPHDPAERGPKMFQKKYERRRPVEHEHNTTAENRFRVDLDEDKRNVIQSPHQPQGLALEDIQEVNNSDSNSTNSSYKLPDRINRGKVTRQV